MNGEAVLSLDASAGVLYNRLCWRKLQHGRRQSKPDPGMGFPIINGWRTADLTHRPSSLTILDGEIPYLHHFCQIIVRQADAPLCRRDRAKTMTSRNTTAATSLATIAPSIWISTEMAFL
jgi:hypothetical protein